MRRLICTTCGWSAPAPEAPTQFGTAVWRAMVAAGHTLQMALLDGGRRQHHVQLQPPPVTVTLNIDTTAFVEGMTRASRAVDQMGGRLGEIGYRNRLLAERTLARRWYLDYITSVYAEYGWEWPGPVERTAR